MRSLDRSVLSALLLLALLAAASVAAGQRRPAVGDPCAEPEVTIQLVFDLYQGQVARSEGRKLDALAARLRACPDKAFELQVHTDTVRMSSFNARQSQAVADHVRQLLVERGIPATRLVACGYGESHPLQQDPNWNGRAPNNRLVVRALPGEASAYHCPEIH